ncbi:MAG: histidine--tRNA ligase [Acidobacteriia bacterium]|nr:histidine--tRNA ligase [Terriglobia bacterium]
MIKAIRGTRDILPPESGAFQYVETLAREVFRVFNFDEIRTPIFESAELFARSVGTETDIVSKEMYTFADRDETTLALRPEATASVVRAFIELQMSQEPGLKRFYYIGPMFRRERPQKGRYRQFYQIGAEVLGGDHPAIDAEVIEMVVEYLNRLGIRPFSLLLNSIGDSKCRPNFVKALKAAAGEVRDKLCENCQRRLETNPLRVLDCKVESCQPYINRFPSILEYLCADCQAHFSELRGLLDARGIAYQITPRMVRGLDYYTRTTFEITSDLLGAQNSLLGGGRYDGLSESIGGPPVKGIGFAIGLDRFVMVLTQIRPELGMDRPQVYVAWLGTKTLSKAYELTRMLRRAGVRCAIEFDEMKLKKALSNADRLKAAFVLIVGEDEIAKNKFGLKDMKGGSQVFLEERELVTRIQGAREGSAVPA